MVELVVDDSDDLEICSGVYFEPELLSQGLCLVSNLEQVDGLQKSGGSSIVSDERWLEQAIPLNILLGYFRRLCLVEDLNFLTLYTEAVDNFGEGFLIRDGNTRVLFTLSLAAQGGPLISDDLSSLGIAQIGCHCFSSEEWVECSLVAARRCRVKGHLELLGGVGLFNHVSTANIIFQSVVRDHFKICFL